jgi:hypothetical protein
LLNFQAPMRMIIRITLNHFTTHRTLNFSFTLKSSRYFFTPCDCHLMNWHHHHQLVIHLHFIKIMRFIIFSSFSIPLSFSLFTF